MKKLNWVCFLLYLPLLFSTFSESCLDATAEPLISGSIYQVPNQLFEADSVDDKYTPEQARLEGLSWCSSNSLTPSSEPWLQVTFTKLFNISIIQTGGLDGILRNYYLTSFQVHIGDGTEESLHPLTISDDATQPVVFLRKKTYDVENTVLPSPVIAKVLRIVAVSWRPSNQVCVRLEAFGCPIVIAPPTIPMVSTEPNTEESSTVVVSTTSTEPITEASSYTTQETDEISEASSFTAQNTPLTEEISEASNGTTQEISMGQSSNVIVGAAVGGVLFLIVTLLVVVIVVAVIFTFTRRRSAQVQLSASCEASVENNFDNSIYGEEIDLSSNYKDTPEKTINNSIYGNKDEFNTGYHRLTRPDIVSNLPSTTSESVPSTITTTIYEPINGCTDSISELSPVYGNRYS